MAVGFFKSITLSQNRIEFVDATFGYNNPCEVLIEEAKDRFKDRRQMRILSIGTGLEDVVGIEDLPKSITDALRKMGSSSKKVARKLNSQFGNGGQYFRFNVEESFKTKHNFQIGKRPVRSRPTLKII